jgi:hypothetical protein
MFRLTSSPHLWMKRAVFGWNLSSILKIKIGSLLSANGEIFPRGCLWREGCSWFFFKILMNIFLIPPFLAAGIPSEKGSLLLLFYESNPGLKCILRGDIPPLRYDSCCSPALRYSVWQGCVCRKDSSLRSQILRNIFCAASFISLASLYDAGLDIWPLVSESVEHQ